MTLQPRAILAHPNFLEPQYAPSVTATVTKITPTFLGVGSWLAGLPLTNLTTGKFYKPARSTNATNASTKFAIDFSVARPLSVIGLIRHNLTPVVGTSRVRITVANDSAFATPLNTPAWVNAYQPFYAPGTLPWGWDPAVWTGGPTQMDLQHYKSLSHTQVLDQLYVARYLLIEIDDTTNTAGYVEIGGVFAGPGYQPTINFSYGASIGWVDPSTVTVGDGGNRFVNTRPRYRQVQFVWEPLGIDQGMEIPFEFEGRAGLSATCYFVLDPTSLYHLHRWSFPCTLEELSALEFPYWNATRKAFKLSEKI